MKRNTRFREIHFYEWYISRWQTSDAHDELDATGRGIYREMLDVCYAQGSVTANPDVLCRRCACTREELDSRWAAIRRHFQVHKSDKGKLVNRYANVVRREYFHYVTQQARKGAKGGKSRGSHKYNEDSEIESTGLAVAKPLVKPGGSQERRKKDKDKDKKKDTPLHPPRGDVLPLLDEPPFDATTEERRDAWEIELEPTAKRMLDRHKNRKCSLGFLKDRLKVILEDETPTRRLAALQAIESNHAAWCQSYDWTRDGGKYQKNLEFWLTISKRRWEVPPSKFNPESDEQPRGMTGAEYAAHLESLRNRAQ